jgi:branched-chain amino acid transport system ATP-binding protein
MSAPVLALDSVTKRFGGLAAVDDVSLTVAPGEHCVLLGPNGAGKTTLFHLVTGTLFPSAGRIALFGRDVTRLGAAARCRLGVGRTFQISNVFPHLTPLQNVVLALHGARDGAWNFLMPWRSDRRAVERAEALLERVGLSEHGHTEVTSLSYGARRQLELALALAPEPRAVFLDEPCAGLSGAERARVVEIVRALPETITLVMVEHDMDVAFEVARRLVVMNRGRLIADGAPEAVRADPVVQEVYLGVA